MPTFTFPSLGRHPGILNIMKIDIVSVFPEYFEVLNLSLLGKAQTKGLVGSDRAQSARLDARRASFRR